MEKVERIQYQAALTITGAWLGSNLTKFYGELGWESLSNLTKLYEELGWDSLSDRTKLYEELGWDSLSVV